MMDVQDEQTIAVIEAGLKNILQNFIAAAREVNFRKINEVVIILLLQDQLSLLVLQKGLRICKDWESIHLLLRCGGSKPCI